MNSFPAIITTTTNNNTEGDTTTILDHQHQDQQQQQQQIDEICDLFSTTIHSLGEDAIAIRQISSLAEICGIKTYTAAAAASASAASNNKNNAVAVASDEIIINWDDPNLQQLIEIDTLVTKIEEKVNALRSIVSEEKSALEKFETTLQQEANLQSIVVEQMTDAMIQQLRIDVLQERSTTTTAAAGSNNNINNNNNISRTTKKYNSKKTKSSSFGGGRKRRDSVDPRSKMMTTMNNRRTPFSSFDDEDYDDDDDDDDEEQSQEEEEAISLERVTLSELRQIPRQTLGRISLMDLNEALQEIEKVCDNRLKAIMPNMIIKNKKRNHYHYYGSAASPSSSSSLSSHNISTTTNNNNTLQRRLDYLKQHRSTNNSVDIEVEAHAGHLWVSEQELRENCAFFRHGEATARATLSILCALKRLKQVPGKNSEITYILSSPPQQQQQT